MPRNKPRLQVALYSRPKHPGSYHYALFVASKNGLGQITKHHVKNTLLIDPTGEATAPWRYERTMVSDVGAEQRLLARIVIGKVVVSDEEVQRLVEEVPILQIDDPDTATAQSFTCQTWVRDVFQELRRQEAIATIFEEWEEVEQNASEYVETKREQRRWSGSWKGDSAVPLMDLLQGKEIVA